jgi:hypothetical protein
MTWERNPILVLDLRQFWRTVLANVPFRRTLKHLHKDYLRGVCRTWNKYWIEHKQLPWGKPLLSYNKALDKLNKEHNENLRKLDIEVIDKLYQMGMWGNANFLNKLLHTNIRGRTLSRLCRAAKRKGMLVPIDVLSINIKAGWKDLRLIQFISVAKPL